LALAVVLPLVVWPQVQTIRWGLASGRGMVLAWYAHLSDASEALTQANEIQPRYESFYNLGLLLKFNPDGGLRPAMAAFQSAVELRPGSAMARFALADCFSRIAPPNKEEAEEALGKTSALLERALDIDPNLFKASELLSDVYFIHQEPDRALETLRRVIERPIPESAKFEAYVRIGRMYEESKEDPTRALEFYEKAIPLISTKEQAEYLKHRVATAEKWKKDGQRPEEGAEEEEHPHGATHEAGGDADEGSGHAVEGDAHAHEGSGAH
jgi:tetratricopeptide (TPR) repeat protein